LLPRATLLVAGSAVLSAALILLFRPTTDLATFRSSVFIFDQWVRHPAFTDDYGLTIVPLFYRFNLARALVPLQALVCVAYFLYGAFIRPKKLMACATACLIVFIAINPHFWIYFWLSPALWALLSADAHP
jgi:hypothetical protein